MAVVSIMTDLVASGAHTVNTLTPADVDLDHLRAWLRVTYAHTWPEGALAGTKLCGLRTCSALTVKFCYPKGFGSEVGVS